MTIYLFIILSLLFALEASTSLARRCGYEIGNPASGLILQSSLSLMSRFLMFLFMPVIGMSADSNTLTGNPFSVLVGFSFILVALFLLLAIREGVSKCFSHLLFRVNNTGSFFKRVKDNSYLNVTKRKYKFKIRFFWLYLKTYLAYIPYYLSWPVIILLLSFYPDNRGFILGLSGVLNGVNTIIITLFVDPKLAQIGKYPRVIYRVYTELLNLRIYSAITSFIFLIFIVLAFQNE